MINTYGFEVGQRVMTAKYKKNLDIYSYKEKEIEDIKPFTAEDEYEEYQNDMQSQFKKDLEEASA